jgi:hypothetical protein
MLSRVALNNLGLIDDDDSNALQELEDEDIEYHEAVIDFMAAQSRLPHEEAVARRTALEARYIDVLRRALPILRRVVAAYDRRTKQRK